MDASLWAVSPLDGRYADKLKGLGELASEAGLVSYRLKVEAEWLLFLADEKALGGALTLTPAGRKALSAPLPDGAAARVKALEKTTNHDVKAVEYYLRELLTGAGEGDRTLAFIHFACTSEDINNLSYALMLRDLRDKRLLPLMDDLVKDLARRSAEHAALPMLARTHGQTASPTTLGKELAVFAHRLDRQRRALGAVPLLAKMNGAVGNFNAHLAAFPEVDWPALSRRFVEGRLGLVMNPLTTQIESHDGLCEMASAIRHFNAILLGLCRDVWGYVSLGYFKQKTVAGEVGSSTMPHKVNPIDFENAEGNLGLANALAAHFGEKLTISRWQRDLSDSTVLRSLGSLAGYSELAYRSALRGLGKLEVDARRIDEDLEAAYEVLAEPVQTVMRRYGVADAYERLKAATRGKPVTKAVMAELVEGCAELPRAEKERLKAMTPRSYVGAAEKLAREAAQRLGAKH